MVTNPAAPLSGTIQPLTRGEACWCLSREIVRDLAALALRGVRRTRERVHADYEQGVWKRSLDQQPWTRYTSLEQYLVTNTVTRRIALIANQLVRIRTDDYYRYRHRFLLGVLEEFAGDRDEVVEIGCGSGMNLFALSQWGKWRTLRGFDISDNALAAGRQIARHFGVASVHFDGLDLSDGRDPRWGSLRDKTVFTYYCLEQLKHAFDTVMANLLRCGVRRVINIEPSTELLPRWSLRGLANALYIRRRDYQPVLMWPLQELQRAGAVRLVAARRLNYAPSPKNDPLMVVWEPVRP